MVRPSECSRGTPHPPAPFPAWEVKFRGSHFEEPERRRPCNHGPLRRPESPASTPRSTSSPAGSVRGAAPHASFLCSARSGVGGAAWATYANTSTPRCTRTLGLPAQLRQRPYGDGASPFAPAELTCYGRCTARGSRNRIARDVTSTDQRTPPASPEPGGASALMLVIPHDVDGTEQRFSWSSSPRMGHTTNSRPRSTFLRGNMHGPRWRSATTAPSELGELPLVFFLA